MNHFTLCECWCSNEWSVSLLGDAKATAAAVQAVVFNSHATRLCHYLKAFREGENEVRSRCSSLSCCWRARQSSSISDKVENHLRGPLSCFGHYSTRLILQPQHRTAFFPPSVTIFHNTFSLVPLSHTQILTQADSEREKDGWHISWGEAANIIWNSSALISMFSNLSRDLYVLPERASILTKPWPWSSSLTAPVSHDRCFSWPPDIFLGSHGPLSGLVNFALSAPQLLAYECPHSHTYSTAVHGAFKKWSF